MRAPDRETLRSHSPLLLRTGRNWTKADIFLWQDGATCLAIKDYGARPPWIRSTLGRFLIRREFAAYSRLAGIDGIPPLAGRVDAYALAVGFVDGKDLSHFGRGEVPAGFFAKLRDLVEGIHRAGVAHGDLHHRDILIASDGTPALIDFSTAVLRPPRAGFLRHWLFDAARGSDLRAVLKLKQRHYPKSLSDDERYQLDHPPFWYRWGKRLRFLISSRSRSKSGLIDASRRHDDR